MVVSPMSCTDIKWRTGSITIVHTYYIIVAIVDPSFTTREGDATKIVSRLFFAGDHAHYHAHYHSGDHAQEAETQDEEVQHRATGMQIQSYLNFYIFICLCVPVCARLFVQH